MHCLRVFLLLTIAFFFANSAFANELELTPKDCLRKGDSILNQLNIEGARYWYNKAVATSTEGTDLWWYGRYYYAYTFILERDEVEAKSLMIKLEKDINASDCPDSVLCYLVGKEVDGLFDFKNSTYVSFNSYLRFVNEKPMSDRMMVRLNLLIASELYFYGGVYDARPLCNKILDSPLSDNFLKGGALILSAKCYFDLREYNRAIEILLKVKEQPILYKMLYGVDFYLGKSYIRTSRYNDALFYFEKTLMKAKASNDSSKMVYSYTQIGHCYLLTGNYDRALASYKKSELMAKGSRVIVRNKVLMHNSFMYFYRYIGEYKKQKKHIKAIEKLIREPLPIAARLESIIRVQIYYEGCGDFERAYNVLNEYIDEASAEHLKFLYDYQSVLNRKYIAAYKIWQLDSSNVQWIRRSYEGFKELAELQKNSMAAIQERESRFAYLDELREPFGNAFIAGYDLFNVTKDSSLLPELFEFIEGGKSIVFKKNLKAAEAIRFTTIPKEIVEKEGTIKGKISVLRRMVYSSEIGNESGQIVNELIEETTKYDSLKSFIKNNYSEYYSLVYEDDFHDALKYAKDRLSDSQVLINYFIIKNRLFTYVVSSDTVLLKEVKVEKGVELSEVLLNFRMLIDGSGKKSNCYKQEFSLFAQKANQLYDWLIAPIKEVVEGKRLIIVPDVELNLLPFETLVVDTVAEFSKGYAGLNYLIKNNPISVLYTSMQLTKVDETISKSSRYVGFAPNYDVLKGGWDVLPGAQNEVEYIKKIFGGESFHERDANVENFFDKAPSSDIVHLSMHIHLDDQDPIFSCLMFSKSDKDEVDTMPLYRVYGHGFNVKLMVLSGCNSGNGRLQVNEGVMNLARTFFYSGVKNIILTLWETSDRSGEKLMRYFYANLDKEVGADVALQKAKIQFLKESDPMLHPPYFWSCYVLVGEPVLVKKRSIAIYLICAMLVVVSLMFTYKGVVRKIGGGAP